MSNPGTSEPAVMVEVARAVAKFPTWPSDPLHALAVLGEEFGELTKAVLQFTYEPHKTSAEEVRSEAIQTAAMSLRFIASLDVYEYRRGEQHKQGALTPPAAAPEPDPRGTHAEKYFTDKGIDRIVAAAAVVTGTEAEICADITRRQQFGIKKYGTTVEANPLPLPEWLEHAYYEALDLAVYLKRAIAEQRK